MTFFFFCKKHKTIDIWMIMKKGKSKDKKKSERRQQT